ncbi:3-dehydroquinate dehydratase [Sagittula marina]|uniref:3-dehydroquinate dehydratase n=2 Tax=Sagittula marina TaxID=943940 RepID=A0A7W6DLG6_9RHOB|nr:3-dehydroquinate dehydratase [Sagittula marina]
MKWIKQARGTRDGLLVTPAGFTSTSIAILHSLLIHDGPLIEAYISPLFKRDAFRHVSFVTKATTAKIEGFGIRRYAFAPRKRTEIARN